MKYTDPIYFQYLMLEYERIRAKYRKPLEKSSASATINADSYPKHAGRVGYVGGSPPRDCAVEGPNGKMIAKRHNPDDYSNLTVGSADNTKRHEIGGFEGKGKEQRHITKHMESMGYKPNQERQYKADAVEFMSKPLSETMEELEVDGKVGRKIYRYDYRTNEFGVINSRDNVSTYYKPDKKETFWEGVIRDYGKRK